MRKSVVLLGYKRPEEATEGKDTAEKLNDFLVFRAYQRRYLIQINSSQIKYCQMVISIKERLELIGN